MVVTLCGLPFAESIGGPSLSLGVIYWIGIVVLAMLLFYEHSLVRPDDLDRVNMAFFNVNAIVSVGLFCVVTVDLFV